MASQNLTPTENADLKKAVYKKITRALLREADELTTLCDTDTCVIIYNPYDTQPVVWPDVPAAENVMYRFQSMPAVERSKTMLDQESFTRQRIAKVARLATRLRESNKEKEMKEEMYRCLIGRQGVENMGMEDVNHLGMLLVQTIKEISIRMEKLANGEGSSKMAEEVTPMEEENDGVKTIEKPQGFGEWVNEHVSLVNELKKMMPFGDHNN